MPKKIVQNTKSIIELTIDKLHEGCQEKMNSVIFDKRGLEKEYLLLFKFKTLNSSDIKKSLLKESANIDRTRGKNLLSQYIEFHIAWQIERGIFEFALVYVTVNRLHEYFVNAIYEEKLIDICTNLDQSNLTINNATLLPTLCEGSFNPYFTAFLSPEQLHPKKWISVVQKKQIRDEAINTQPYSDIYTCAKCHESKFKISEIQLRCADEPTNRICQCMVCYHTFIK